MDRPLKLFDVSASVYDYKQQTNKNDAHRKLSLGKGKADELENRVSNLPEQTQKFPSFHEVLGPVLTGCVFEPIFFTY